MQHKNTKPHRRIFANFDKKGIVIYQAFKPSTAKVALEKQTFGKGFTFDRLTWIKPSFGWILHRSQYATKHRQERILRITLSHEGFRKILFLAISTFFEADVYFSETEWRQVLEHSEVRYQWDPDRDILGKPIEKRAIQLGLRGEIVKEYVYQFIQEIEDATPLAKAILRAKQSKTPLPTVPLEREYPVEKTLAKQLAFDLLK